MDTSRAGVAAALVAVVAVPLFTLHPLEAHLHDAGDAVIPAQFHEVTLIGLLTVVGLSFVPLLLVLALGARCLRRATALRLLHASAEGECTEGGVAYTLVEIPGVHFFTAGVLRSRVYATTDARQQLPPGVFKAAILHEREHQRRHDVAWRCALAALEAAFCPLPGGRRLTHRVALEWELAADRAALRAGAQPEHLFEALVAASGGQHPAPGVPLSSLGTMDRLEVLATRQPPGHPDPSVRIAGYAAALGLVPLAVHLAFWAGAVCL